MLTISVNADANISNRFETDYELGTVMSIESMLKSCLKHVQLVSFNRFYSSYARLQSHTRVKNITRT